MTRAALALAALLLVATLAPLAALGAGPLRALVVDRLAPDALPPAPTLRLLSPGDGEGVGRALVLAGEARSEKGRILDVQVRLDGAPWESLPDAPRGASSSPFRVQLALPPGEHVVEARASDGDAWSLPARVRVAAGEVAPPTVRIVAPSDGDGLAAGPVDVLGTVSGPGPWRVVVAVDGEARDALVVGGDDAGALWSATVDVPRGAREITAVAEAAGGWGLPQRVRVAADDAAPPTLSVLRPQPGAAFGSAGDDACPSTCILATGVALGPAPVADVLVALDDGPLTPIAQAGGSLTAAGAQAAWSWPADVDGLYRGPHVLRAVAVDAEGRRGVERVVPFTVRTPHFIDVVGDDAAAPTGTPLSFRVFGLEPGAEATWLLDGAPVATGHEAEIVLREPGPHALAVRSPDAEGRLRAATVPLHALNRPPLVQAFPAEGVATRPLHLSANATDPDGAVARFEWDFGDGGRATTETGAVRHAFPDPGEYVVRVTAIDGHGATATATARVHAANADPLAGFRWTPERPTVLDEVRFVDDSLDPEGRLVSRSWSFDGGPPVGDASPVHTFATRGDHVVALTVADAEGAAATVRRTVRVENLPPVAGFRVDPPFPATGDAVRFLDESRKPDGAILSWAWDFGDGTNATGAAAATHAYAAPGRYAATLVVTDDWGAQASARMEVVVADAAPLVERIVADPPSPRAMDAVRFAATTLDVEGAVERLEWDFGDGANSTDPSPIHRFPRSGRYVVSVAAYDAAGQRGVLNASIDVSNAPPAVALGAVEGLLAGVDTVVEAEATDPDGRIAAYAFDMDGDGAAECVGPSPRCVHAYPSPGTFLLHVTARDDEGTEATAVQLVDVRASAAGLPQVAVARPVEGQALRGEVLLEGTATGTAPIAAVDVQLRDRAWALGAAVGGWTPARGAGEWRLLLDTRPFPDGAYELVVRATDERGNANLTRVGVTLANGRAGSEVTVRVVNLERDQLLSGDLTVRGTAYHPLGLTSVRWRVDDGPWQDAGGTQLAWAIPLAIADLPPGEHVLHVEGFRGLLDRASVDIPFQVPDLRPVLVVEQAPPSTLYARLHAEGRTTPGARVLWRIDSGLWRDAEVEGNRFMVDASTEEARNGPHVVQLKAYDPQTGLQTETVTFHVRVINPLVAEATRVAEAPPARETPLGLPVAVAALGLAALAARTSGRPPRRL